MPNKYAPRNEILIVDDDEFQLELMRNALDDLGMEICEAANGAEALEIFQKRQPLLVVMDINMPVMDGHAACAAMKRLPGGENAAIILITGLEDVAEVQKAYDSGAIEFISKPLDWPMFRMRVKYIMRIQNSYLSVQSSREKLMWAQRAAAVGALEFDPQSRNILFSDEALHVLGLGLDNHEIHLNQAWKAVHPADQRPLLIAYARLMRQNVPINIDVRLAFERGIKLVVHLYGEESLLVAGNRKGISGTIQNITQRKQAEKKILEVAAMKDQFLTNMSHELRTPVNGIMGMTELLSSTKMDHEQALWTAKIREASQHLMCLLNDVLDFAAIESGGIKIKRAPFDLPQTMAGISEFMQPMARKKNLTMTLDLAKDLPKMLTGDVGRIRQVLLNLLGNACKFTEIGSISVHVSLVQESGNWSQVRFAVRDSGCGIPHGKLPFIFDKFMQVNGSLTREHEGTGLGLAISKELIEVMGGKIGVQSTEGQGTEIWFVLPLGHADNPQIGSPQVGLTSPQTSWDTTTQRILLVEDNAINQLFAKKLLQRQGFVVDIANNGQEAVSMVQNSNYDAVLMDCQMPVMDGYDATRNIRKLGPKYLELPIIAVTAHALKGDRSKCLDAGMDDYLSKPISGKELFQTLVQWTKSTAHA